MPVRTVAVCEAQVPFVRGGAEYHVRELVNQLRAHGYQAELVSLPFKWYPKEELFAHAAAWRLIDLGESNGQPIDLAIASKFPTYFVRHPRKVTWLVHQYRAAYELCGTPFSDFEHVERDVGVRDRLIRLDTEMLRESAKLLAIARNVAARLERFNGLKADTVYPPPRLGPRLRPGPYGDYVLSVGRLESVKRVDLAIRAMSLVDEPLRLRVVGEGTQRAALERIAVETGVGHRVDFLGALDEQSLLDQYAGALTVVYAPYDEDYGYVTLESFLARKPVVTADDSGGTLEFVEDGVSGCVCAPVPEALASAFNRLSADRRRAAALGDIGFERARRITWDGVIEKLVGS